MRKKSLRSRAKAALKSGAAASGTITLATMGLSTCAGCDNGSGVSDPVPPPPLVCKDGNHGQNLVADAVLDSLSLRVDLYDYEHSYVGIDTAYVTNVTNAKLDSLQTDSERHFYVFLTLDSLTVNQVKFTLKGTWNLKAGPCNFQRTFTCTIKPNGDVNVTQREHRLPLDVPRDVHIELVDRDGLRVNLRAAVAGEGTPEWRATAGKLERIGRLGVTWELPSDPGYYQIELSVDRGVHGIGFDALALEVS